MQQSLPELPPMPAAGPKPMPVPEAMPAAPTERPGSVNRNYQPSGSPFGRRLRQMVGFVLGGGMVVTVLAVILQFIALPQFKPTTIFGMMEAGTELAIMNQKLGVEPGKIVYTEADVREKLANAERKGQAAAELDFQKQMAVVQADKERVVQAYATLYQRTNYIAQGAIQLEGVAQQFRQRLLEMANGGRATIIAVQDGLCAFGNQNACEAARKLRAEMIAESTQLSQSDIGDKIRQLMTGIDDPATFITHEDQTRNGTPKLDR